MGKERNGMAMPKGFSPGLVKKLPALDMSKVWTDEALYAHFNLTPEEIEYIEPDVK